MINYEPIEVLNRSENGATVVKVRDKDNGKIYVLKLVGPLDNKLNNLIFKREINALKSLNKYENIVKIYDSDINIKYNGKKNLGGILLEYVEGCTLDQIDLSQLSELKKFDLCLKICKAIGNAHNNGIIHRDIKPQNIMVINGKIKMIDFGSSKIKTIIEKETTMPLFSPNYSAPEVVAGGETDESSDIYSLGVVFFEVILGKNPSTNKAMIDEIEKAELIEDLSKLLFTMLQYEPSNRLKDINVAINIFNKMIGELNVNAFKFSFSIDSQKLVDLKKLYVVEDKMTMTQFTTIFLQKDFHNMFGMYDTEKDIYKFIGDSVYIECIFDATKSIFAVATIYEIFVDHRIKLQRLYCEVEGKIEFLDSRSSGIVFNNNRQLKVILANHSSTLRSLESKSKLFDSLFGKWRQSLLESIETIKSKNGKISYNGYDISEGRLVLKLKEYENNSIDNIDVDTRFIFEEESKGRIRTYSVGNYEDIIYDDNEIKLVIALSPKSQLNKIKSFLGSNKDLLEDYIYKINSFRRQMTAITALRDDECSSKNLKDIILELEVPTATPLIKSIKYHYQGLNDSQKDAVNKAIFSDSISLIQGPPGTGKTKVINEILNQLISKQNKTTEVPKILVVSQSHTAVDNILECIKIPDSNVGVRIIRIGDKKNISKKIAGQYIMDAIRENMFSLVKENSTKFLANKIELFDQDNSEKVKWLCIKEIQNDWIKRCGDYEVFDYQIINSASIIAGTCIGFLSNEFVRDMYFDYVIVDEAAKATTPELLVSIIKAKKIILVGDQKQLPPFADGNLSKLSIELTKNPEYRLFDILFEILPETHRQILTTQYRMIRNIGDLISKVFYDGTINTGISDELRRHNIPLYSNKSIVWYNTSHLKDRAQRAQQAGSFINPKENKIIKDILSKLNSFENANYLDIGIITGYSAQKNLITKSVNNSDFNNIGKIDINTLDAFQGRENDVIIYSTVRTSKSIGFQKEKERINVAFSRAKKLLMICGDMDFFNSWDDEENKFAQIIDYIKVNTDNCMIIDLQEGEISE